jgi:hypothetical protein
MGGGDPSALDTCVFCVSICTFVPVKQVLLYLLQRRRDGRGRPERDRKLFPDTHLLRCQYLYYCTSKASICTFVLVKQAKLST